MNPLCRPIIRGLSLLLSLGLVGTGIASAQEAGDVNVIQQQIDQVREQSTAAEGVAADAMETPLGVVQEIVITGLPSTKLSVIRRQLSFKVGDTFTQRQRWLSTRRLLELGLFYSVRVDFEPLESSETSPVVEGPPAGESVVEPPPDWVTTPEDAAPAESAESAVEESPAPSTSEPERIDPNRPLKITVTVLQGKSYYAYPYGISEPPYLFGGVIGDRDFFGTGKNVSGAVFSIDDLEYYSLTYDDPQFLGGHHRAILTAQLSDSAINIRDEFNPSTGESYFLGKDGINFTYYTSHDSKYVVNWGLEAYNIETDLRSGTLVGNSKTFLLSKTDISDGTLVYLKGGIRENHIRGYPLVNDGYYWSVDTDQSLEALGSLSTFGRYKFNGAMFFPITDDGHCLAAHIRFDTSTGDVPHYEAPLAGPFIRGYSGTDFYSKSALTINTEARYMIDPEIGQIVAFFDAGKGFDSATPKLEDLEYGYGLGVRLRTLKYLPVDLVLYADYAWGSDDTEINVGIGQWF